MPNPISSILGIYQAGPSTAWHIDLQTYTSMQSGAGSLSTSIKGEIEIAVIGQPDQTVAFPWTPSSGTYLVDGSDLYLATSGWISVPSPIAGLKPAYLSIAVSMTGYIESYGNAGSKLIAQASCAYSMPGNAQHTSSVLVSLSK